MTTITVVTTPPGGVVKAFISPTCFFYKQSTAAPACSKAGIASFKASSAFALVLAADSAAMLVFSSSILARAFSSDAIELYYETSSIITLVSPRFFYTSTIFIASSSWRPFTFDEVSLII